MEEFESAVFSLFMVAICDLELLQTATPMRRFPIDHLIDVNKKVLYPITVITL